VGPTSTAWMKDKVRSAVRKAFNETLSNILKDLESGSPLPITPDESGTPLAAAASPGGNKDPSILSAEIEDALFDFLSDGEKGTRRSCGEKVCTYLI
jgi:hypothetical protein